MKLELTAVHWLTAEQRLSPAELCELSGLEPNELTRLMELGALTPLPAAGETCFSGDCLATARIAARLRRDFELDDSGVSLALTLLERIRVLESELRALQARLPATHR